MLIGVRPALTEDLPFLWTALYYASHSDDEGKSVEDIRSEPTLQRYLADWGREGDLGVIAHLESTEVGAAWVRLFQTADMADPTFVDEGTPELAIAVLPSYQGLGAGTAMLNGLIQMARGVYPAIVLSVRAGNPAVRLYLRQGFREVAQITNRVGTASLKMVLDLDRID